MPIVIFGVVIVIGAVLAFVMIGGTSSDETNTTPITAVESAREAVEAAEEASAVRGAPVDEEAMVPNDSARITDEAFDPTDDERILTAEASYFTPRRTEHEILVSLTLKDRVVVDADVTYDGGAGVTPSHQAFDAAYTSEVVGKRLNEINLSRVGGASLTSEAFNEAVAAMRAQS
jgi:hypothetical protein